MLLLAVDTSGKYGSIALATAHDDHISEIREVVPLAGGTFSAQLIPQIAALLIKQGFTKADIDAFAVGSGPGSFTGLRVGLAAIKALSEAIAKPLAVVSLLEAVAAAGSSSGQVVSAMDAGRGEIYTGEYDIGLRATMRSERLLSREEFLAVAAGSPVVTPDADVATIARHAGLRVEQIEHPRSDAIARLGWKKIQSGETVSPENLEANYIRRSDAEIFLRPVS